MRRWLILAGSFLLASCGGGGSLPDDGGGAGVAADAVQLELSATQEGAQWRVTLCASRAIDLYQIAGSLMFDPAAYQVSEACAGGGLGPEESTFFTSGETAPGRLGFAYTKRYWGSGADGDVPLLSVLVTPAAGFTLSDFSLDQTEGALVARDSKKQTLTATCTSGVQQ